MTFLSTERRSSLDDVLAGELTRLRDLDRERTLRRVEHRRGAIVDTVFGAAVDFSSNDYLGLASDPRLAAAAAHALADQGVGAAAARLIAGNNPEHDALETELAQYFAVERALIFSNGYTANVGIIPALVGRGDVVFSDALNHASLIDGCRLSRAEVHVYPHRDMRVLAALLDRHRGSARRALIVTDGLFSMDGDFAPLGEIVELARRFDAWTYVDDAHALGVVGDDGRGSLVRANVAGEVDVVIGTFGKAFGVAGAFVLGSATLVQYLVNRARSFVFSTGMMPAQAAAAREGLRIAALEPERRAVVRRNSRLMRAALDAAVVAPLAANEEPTHIIPVMIGEDARTMRIGRALGRRGFLVAAIRPPTVPDGGARLRITVNAAHTEDQIAEFTAALATSLHE